MRLRVLLASGVVLAVSILLHSVTARPQAGDKVPGFRLSIENGTAKDTTSSRLVSLYVPAGTRPSPLVPAGAFKATWQGDLQFELPEDLTFSAEGRGKLTVRLADRVLLEASGDDFSKTPGKKIEVPGEPTPLTVTYEAPAEGDAVIRLSWKGDTFVREPVSFAFAKHDAETKEQKTSTRQREGRQSLAHLHCIKCHKADILPTAMPELKADAPSLATIGGRANAEWLAHWIHDPQALRPQATMPKMLAPSDRGPQADARDLAAYLVSLGAVPEKQEPPVAEETINKGARLFSHLGCISCHLMPAREDLADADHQRIPLRHVAAKWKPAALRAFLLAPAAHYQWIRMPDFGLSAEEANQLAGFLLKTSTTKLSDPPLAKGDAMRGKLLIAEKNCLACHAVAEDRKLTSPMAPALADLKKPTAGCLADTVTPGGKVPTFALDANRRAALRATLPEAATLIGHDAPIDLTTRSLAWLRCNSCHQRDGKDDVLTRLRDESDGLLNEYPGDDPEKDPIGQPFPAVQLRPPLTWTGEKLRPEWLTAFLTGKIDYKPRPYLRARMPKFTGPMDGVARGFVLEHGRAPTSPLKPVNVEMAEVGRTLSGRKNWGCIACHNVGKSVAEAAFEAPGINFSYSRERLTRDYYERWVYSPLRVEPGTKMPAVFQIGKPSLLKEFFDGSSEKQVEAIWQYFQMGEKIRYPEE